jgi:hypothetical protein
VRLAFLDVLQNEPQSRVGVPTQQGWVTPGTLELTPTGYAPYGAPNGPVGWLNRYQGLLALFSVLALCLVAGLLVGHWVTQKATTAPQIVKIEGSGLSSAPTSTSATPTTGAESESASSAGEEKLSKKEEEAGEAEAKKETKAEKAPPPAAKKVDTTTLKKLTKSSGKKHQEEINALGDTPIETG